MTERFAIKDFELPNPIYSGVFVTFYVVVAGTRSVTKAALYAEMNGSMTLKNPQYLDEEGKFVQPVYVAEPVIAVVGPEYSSGELLAIPDVPSQGSLTDWYTPVNPASFLYVPTANNPQYIDNVLMKISLSPFELSSVLAMPAQTNNNLPTTLFSNAGGDAIVMLTQSNPGYILVVPIDGSATQAIALPTNIMSPSSSVVLSQDGYAYCAASDVVSGVLYLLKINRTTYAVTATSLSPYIPTGFTSYQDIAIDAAETFLYMAIPHKILKVNVATLAVVAELNAPGSGSFDSILRVGNYLYTSASDGAPAYIYKIDLTSFTISSTLSTGTSVWLSLIGDLAGDYIYGFASATKRYRLNLSTFAVDVTNTSSSASGIALGMELGDYLYIVSSTSKVYKYDKLTLAEIATVDGWTYADTLGLGMAKLP